MIKNITRALRLPFISASILPFVFGSFIPEQNFNLRGFLLGLIAASSMHLSANLINDYADALSGADWQDREFYKFFGGSKLIQENVFSKEFYLRLSIFFAGLSCISVILLALALKSLLVLGAHLAIIILSWSYSLGPLRFSYRRVGEVFIFLLFGPVLVMGGYFIQTGIFPDAKSLILSLPFGLLTTAILFANEVPDLRTDKSAGKLTWVSLVGAHNSFILYSLLIFLAFFSIAAAIFLGYLSSIAAISFIFILPAIKAAMVLKNNFEDKVKLIESSKLTIALHSLVSIILILSIL